MTEPNKPGEPSGGPKCDAKKCCGGAAGAAGWIVAVIGVAAMLYLYNGVKGERDDLKTQLQQNKGEMETLKTERMAAIQRAREADKLRAEVEKLKGTGAATTAP